MAKLRKSEILEKISNGSTLVRKFDRMYGTYFYLINIDSTCIYNVNKNDCKTITNMNQLIKKMIDPNTFEFYK